MTTRDSVTAPFAAHPSDADLVRLLDGEAAPGVAGHAESHVAACAECAARLAALRARSFSLSALLLATDPPVPAPDRLRPPARPAARRIPQLRAAAALLVVATGIAAAATPAVRGWVSSRVSGAVSVKKSPAVVPAAPSPEAAGAVIGFAVERAELTVRVKQPQTSGVLELRADTSALASAEVLRGAGEGLVVLPGVLELRNRERSTASYRVSLPPTASAVIVRVGRAPPRRITRDSIVRAGTIRVPLSVP